MIITSDNDTVVKGNVGTNAKHLTVDAEDARHIMQMMTNIYSNNHVAVAREYVANALDSHTEAGQTRPVEIRTPNEWEPRLIVQDFGVGLSADDIENVYGVYFKSTRRNSNEGIGGLGIGAKSGFTLSGQFVVTAIKDGEKTVALFSLDNEGVPSSEILNRSLTDEGNGVTVSIAVDDYRKMNRAIESLSRTWPRDRILINGKTIHNSIYDTAISIGNGIYVVDSSWGLTVEMGGVAYSVPQSVINDLGKADALSVSGLVWTRLTNNGMGILARVPIGSVAIAPSRETLRNTPQTVAALKNILDGVGSHYSEELQKICRRARNGIEANILLTAHEGYLGQAFLRKQSWRQYKLANLSLTYPHITIGHNRGRAVAVEEGRPFTIASMASEEYYGSHLFITGVKPDDSGKVRRLATRYLTSNTNSHKTITVVPTKVGRHEWFSWGDNNYITTMTLDEFRQAARKIPSASSRNETTYENYILVDGLRGPVWKRNHRMTASAIAEMADAELYFGGNTWSYAVKAFQIGDMLVDINNRQKRSNLEERLGQTLVDASDISAKYAETLISGVTEMERLITINGGTDYDNVVALQKRLAAANYTNPVLDNLVNEVYKIQSHDRNMSKERRAELHEIRGHLERVDDPVKLGYHEWVAQYVLVARSLTDLVRWGHRSWEPDFAIHLVDYMKMIDNKEAKNV